MIKIAALIAGALLAATPASAQVTEAQARAYVDDQLDSLPYGGPSLSSGSRILNVNGEIEFKLHLTKYGTYALIAACDQDCRAIGAEVTSNLGRREGFSRDSTTAAVVFNGGGIYTFSVWLTACSEAQCLVGYRVIPLD